MFYLLTGYLVNKNKDSVLKSLQYIFLKRAAERARSILLERGAGAAIHLYLCSGERERRFNFRHVAGAAVPFLRSAANLFPQHTHRCILRSPHRHRAPQRHVPPRGENQLKVK